MAVFDPMCGAPVRTCPPLCVCGGGVERVLGMRLCLRMPGTGPVRGCFTCSSVIEDAEFSFKYRLAMAGLLPNATHGHRVATGASSHLEIFGGG